MKYDLSDTIAAIASSPAGAARGIVRISGPRAAEVIASCFHGPPVESIETARAVKGQFVAGPELGLAPCDLYYFPGQRSYTRQPSAEIHTLGSPPVVSAVLRQICQAGARLAEPGEFTLRAFLAGRLDLVQAEAVLGVIEAQSQEELEVALAQLAGGLSAPLKRLRTELLNLLADLEAGLDFVDEDIEFVARNELVQRLEQAKTGIAGLAGQLQSRGDSDMGPKVVLVGEPNVGKSSLFNALTAGEHAIVSPQAGTTRDYLSRRVDCGGVVCQLLDTAGMDALRPSRDQDLLQAAAQEKSQQQLAAAQVVVLCLDSTRPLTPWERQFASDDRPWQGRVVAWTKCDAARHPRRQDLGPADAVLTSAVTGVGLADLKLAIARAASEDGKLGALAGAAVRCRQSLHAAHDAIARASDHASQGSQEELVAAELRVALYELGQVAGAVYTDDLLDRIFSRFCIGK